MTDIDALIVSDIVCGVVSNLETYTVDLTGGEPCCVHFGGSVNHFTPAVKDR
ncbi:hypothetical protein DSECCO2_630310 [anaerobic digester metagenome]